MKNIFPINLLNDLVSKKYRERLNSKILIMHSAESKNDLNCHFFFKEEIVMTNMHTQNAQYH